MLPDLIFPAACISTEMRLLTGMIEYVEYAAATAIGNCRSVFVFPCCNT